MVKEVSRDQRTFPAAPRSIAVLCNSCAISVPFVVGLRAINSAATPATNGEAIEVPVMLAYVPLNIGTVLRMPVPNKKCQREIAAKILLTRVKLTRSSDIDKLVRR